MEESIRKKSMKNKKIITIVSVSLLFTVLVIVASFFIMKERESKNNVEEVKEITEEKRNKEKMVWYEIPEIKIRFLVTEKLSKELIYFYKTVTRTIKEKNGAYESISFSTKTLEGISQYCTAKNGPLGTLSIINGSPNDYIKNTPISRADKVFNGFYIQFTGPQSPCLFGSEHERYEKTTMDEYMGYFHSDIFIDSIEVVN